MEYTNFRFADLEFYSSKYNYIYKDFVYSTHHFTNFLLPIQANFDQNLALISFYKPFQSEFK